MCTSMTFSESKTYTDRGPNSNSFSKNIFQEYQGSDLGLKYRFIRLGI